MKKSFLTSGEFAALCRTTKATLFHYDQKGLLKPRHVSANGYRRYDVRQFFDFDTISIFKETGSSLEEIRQYRQSRDEQSLLKLLEAKLEILEQEQALLARRKIVLHDLSDSLREALNRRHDEVLLEEMAEERLEIIPTGGDSIDAVENYAAYFADYIDFYYMTDEVPRRPFGYILDRSYLSEGSYMETFNFKRASEKTPPGALHVKESGLYAAITHRGTHESHMQCLDILSEYIRKQRLEVCSDCYCYDLAGYAMFGSEESYIAGYCVRVNEKGA
ncbi:MAG TPA: MerR family transcriptional regulator [Candidatus Mailhella merdavium]|nr:MerR family transcriptional regulator [Candidatus Mailhella merdavium]